MKPTMVGAAIGSTGAGAPSLSWELLAGAAVVLLGLLVLVTRGQSGADFLLGLRLGLGGLIAKELRSRSRGWRPMVVLTGYLLLLSGGVLGFLQLARFSSGIVPVTLGTQLFATLSLGAVVLLAFIAPALTASAISGERERRTLDLLLVTRASALGLVLGKLIGSLLYALFLLAASLPAFALVYLYGGVPPRYLVMVFLVAAVTALAHAALALLLSAFLRRTLPALVLSYLVVLTLVLGVPFVAGVLNATGQIQLLSARRGPVPEGTGGAALGTFTYASPVISLASVLPGSAPESDLVGMILRGVLVGDGFLPQPQGLPVWQRRYVVGFDQTSGQPETAIGWAPWVFHFLLCAVLTAGAVLLSALAVMPVKPWRAWRARRRRPVAAAA